MNSEKNIRDTYNTLMDETLLRYLAYNSPNPLEVNSQQPDILTRSDKWTIIDRHFIMTPKTGDIEENTSKISRLCMYLGNRRPQNRKVAQQQIIFDIYVHEDIDLLDLRLSKVRDYLDEKLDDKTITGLGRGMLVGSGNISTTPTGYVGYRMVYEYGSGS